MDTRTNDKWIVGLDLQPSGHGALEYARWLAKANVADEPIGFHGIHVLEDFYLYPMLRHHHLDELLGWANNSLQEEIDSVGAAEFLNEVEVLRGGTVAKALHEQRDKIDATGIIVGRYAPREGRRAVRLGRVVRRVLRHANNPTVVVPPDLTTDSIGDGPIVVATNLQDDSLTAVEFAEHLSRCTGRSLILTYVVRAPRRHGARYMPRASLEAIRATHQKEGEAALEQWAEEKGFLNHDRRVLAGGVVPNLLKLADTENACMIVTGSRRLAKWERMLITSVGGELSATAPCPVVVVPPPIGIKNGAPAEKAEKAEKAD